MNPLTPSDFVAMLASELSLTGVPFERRALLDFVAGAWPLIEDEPDAVAWAREFLAAHGALAAAG